MAACDQRGNGGGIVTVYMLGFFVSVFLIYYSETKEFRGSGVRCCVFLALLIPCLIAGLRDYSIGTDVEVYVKPLFETAREARGFFQYLGAEFYQSDIWSNVNVYKFEIGFTALCYLCAKVFNSMQVLLFVIQALVVVPVFKGVRANKAQPVWLGMAVYYLMFYNNTLNMMRQWIAMAFLFYAFCYLRERKYRKYFSTVVLAMLFHTSVIVGIVIFLVVRLTAGERQRSNRRKAILLIVLGIAVLLNLNVVVAAVKLLGLRYGNYFSGDLVLMPRQLYYRLPILILLATRWKYLKEKDRFAVFYAVMIAYDLLASQLTSVFSYSTRISAYFSEYYMLVYPALCGSSNFENNRRVMRVFVLVFLCIYWWYIYMYTGAGETVPYVSVFG